MPVQDAKMVTIPKVTRTEAIENDFKQIKEIFQGEDLSGLDLEYRRGRKVSVDIEDYLKNLEYNQKIEEEFQVEGPGVFKRNYRMALHEVEAFVIDEEKEDILCEKTTDLDSSTFTNTVNLTVNENQCKIRGDRTTKLEPIKMDLGIDIKARLLHSNASRAGRSAACWKTSKKFLVCPSLSNTRIFTKPGSMIKSNKKAASRKLVSFGSLESGDVFKDISDSDVLLRIQELDEQARRTFSFSPNLHRSRDSQEDDDSPLSDETNLIPIFLENSGAIVLEFRPLLEEGDESPERVSQEVLETVHFYRHPECMSPDLMQDIFSTKLDGLLKQEGSYPAHKFLHKLSDLSLSKPTLGNSSTQGKKYDCEIRSVGKPSESHDDEEDIDQFKKIANRRRSRYVDFDYEVNTDQDTFEPGFTGERSVGRDKEGSFSL